MALTRAREVFFPYVFGEGALRLSLRSCKIDGILADNTWNEDNSECNLVRSAQWKSAELQFEVAYQADGMRLTELVPAAERRKPPVQLIGCAQCRRTYRKIRTEGTFDTSSQSGQISLVLDREDLIDSVEFEVYVVRRTAQEREPRLASDAAARLVSSQLVTIRIDEPQQRQGPGPLQVERSAPPPRLGPCPRECAPPI